MMSRSVALALLALAAAPAAGQDMPLSQVLAPGQGWLPVPFAFQSIASIVGDGRGNVYAADPERQQIIRIGPDGVAAVFARTTAAPHGLAAGSDGSLFASQPEARQIIQFDRKGAEKVIARDLAAHELISADDGVLYCSVPKESAVYRIDGGAKRRVANVVRPTGLVLWPDRRTLVVGDAGGAGAVRAFRIAADGQLQDGERYYRPYAPKETTLEPRGMVFDKESRLYVATRSGVQVFDPIGRLCGVLSRPRDVACSGVAFGGKDLDRLYAAFGSQLFYRPVLSRGLPLSGGTSPGKR